MLSINIQADLAVLVRMPAVDNFQQRLTDEGKFGGSYNHQVWSLYSPWTKLPRDATSILNSSRHLLNTHEDSSRLILGAAITNPRLRVVHH